jgi:hypothetical protein
MLGWFITMDLKAESIWRKWSWSNLKNYHDKHKWVLDVDVLTQPSSHICSKRIAERCAFGLQWLRLISQILLPNNTLLVASLFCCSYSFRLFKHQFSTPVPSANYHKSFYNNFGELRYCLPAASLPYTCVGEDAACARLNQSMTTRCSGDVL